MSLKDMNRMANVSHSTCMFPSEMELADALPPCCDHHDVNRAPFCSLLICTFFIFCTSCWFCCLQWPPSIVLKCCRVFLSTRRLQCALGRRYMCWISFIQALVLVLLVVSSLMNQQYSIFRKRNEIHQSVYEATQESAKVTSTVCEKLWKSNHICGFMRWQAIREVQWTAVSWGWKSENLQSYPRSRKC